MKCYNNSNSKKMIKKQKEQMIGFLKVIQSMLNLNNFKMQFSYLYKNNNKINKLLMMNNACNN